MNFLKANQFKKKLQQENRALDSSWSNEACFTISNICILGHLYSYWIKGAKCVKTQLVWSSYIFPIDLLSKSSFKILYYLFKVKIPRKKLLYCTRFSLATLCNNLLETYKQQKWFLSLCSSWLIWLCRNIWCFSFGWGRIHLMLIEQACCAGCRRRPSTNRQSTPHPEKNAKLFEPVMRLWCTFRFRKVLISLT